MSGTTDPDKLRLDDKVIAFVRAFVESLVCSLGSSANDLNL